jgi:hypothetical protein
LNIDAIERKDFALHLERGGATTNGHHLDGVLAYHEDALCLRYIYRQ